MKKIVLFFLTISIALGLVACQTTTQAVEFESDTELAAFQAISASTLLSANLDSLSNVALPLSNVEEEETEDPIVNDEVDQIDQYLWMMETYLGDEGALAVTAQASDREGYTSMILFTTKTLAGEEITYTLYFNEIEIVEEEEETTEETPLAQGMQPQDKFRFQDPEDANIVSGLEGLLVIGEAEFNLEGKKVVAENREIMILRAYTDEDNHVAVRYMSGEDGDKAFFYTIVVNGELVSRTAVKVFVNGDRIRTSLQFVEGNARGFYQFAIETVDNVSRIHIVYNVTDGEVQEKGNIWIVATFDPETELTTYEYRVLPDPKPARPFGPKPTTQQQQNESQFTRQHKHGHMPRPNQSQTGNQNF